MLRLYPEYQQEFANDIKHDLTFNMREGYENEVSTFIINIIIITIIVTVIVCGCGWLLLLRRGYFSIRIFSMHALIIYKFKPIHYVVVRLSYILCCAAIKTKSLLLFSIQNNTIYIYATPLNFSTSIKNNVVQTM